MRIPLLALAALMALQAPAGAAGDRPAAQVQPRVGHHVRRASEIADHFDAVLRNGCPRFTSPAGWQAYVDGEVDRLVLLLAHVEQAWVEAKTTGDDGVRRAAKAPRRRLGETRSLVDKLSACARDNGARLEVGPLWRRVEREVPVRQAEIALPR
ncbi:MAG TPA: hypothetical protein VGV13_15215 [Methylomirabilota bacterium]|jgi:hypothetical protein|nr:hypothetical protein [Methylomirabilota bacterium]